MGEAGQSHMSFSSGSSVKSRMHRVEQFTDPSTSLSVGYQSEARGLFLEVRMLPAVCELKEAYVSPPDLIVRFLV
ncbi:hypothetical protein EYF80_023436 [Liparis tanakae]|uniref:Uncharacterized protein n=1 Tax=Liparis tanakae TaxID=230148 RepID=A0A4Z2HL74_9TELE|nr:hypothetical protein EYF80_023436 [Liparis tanakae]